LTWKDFLADKYEEVKAEFPRLDYSTAEMIVKISDYNKIAKLYGIEQYQLKDDEYIMLCDFENMKQLQVGNVISPSYGGRTVLSEYEALTGLSNYTLGSDVVVFSSYINENTKAIGGLASQFKKNGYVTTAMHPNIASYYNRDVVYKNLEFDTFLSEKDFKYTEEDLLGDKRLKDSAFFANIKEQMEAVEDPQFIFGVTLAGHSPYIAKYKDTVIIATSESVSDEADAIESIDKIVS